MTMHATVLRVQHRDLLVRDHATSQEVIVHTPAARCYFPREQICIEYNGVMTRSLPPQITAIRIIRISPCDCG